MRIAYKPHEEPAICKHAWRNSCTYVAERIWLIPCMFRNSIFWWYSSSHLLHHQLMLGVPILHIRCLICGSSGGRTIGAWRCLTLTPGLTSPSDHSPHLGLGPGGWWQALGQRKNDPTSPAIPYPIPKTILAYCTKDVFLSVSIPWLSNMYPISFILLYAVDVCVCVCVIWQYAGNVPNSWAFLARFFLSIKIVSSYWLCRSHAQGWCRKWNPKSLQSITYHIGHDTSNLAASHLVCQSPAIIFFAHVRGLDVSMELSLAWLQQQCFPCHQRPASWPVLPAAGPLGPSRAAVPSTLGGALGRALCCAPGA